MGGTNSSWISVDPKIGPSDEIRRKQIDTVIDHLPTNIVANPVCVAIFAAIFLPLVPVPTIIVWVIYSQVINIGRLALILIHRRKQADLTAAAWSRWPQSRAGTRREESAASLGFTGHNRSIPCARS